MLFFSFLVTWFLPSLLECCGNHLNSLNAIRLMWSMSSEPGVRLQGVITRRILINLDTPEIDDISEKNKPKERTTWNVLEIHLDSSYFYKHGLLRPYPDGDTITRFRNRLFFALPVSLWDWFTCSSTRLCSNSSRSALNGLSKARFVVISIQTAQKTAIFNANRITLSGVLCLFRSRRSKRCKCLKAPNTTPKMFD